MSRSAASACGPVVKPSGQGRWPYQSRIQGNSGVGDAASLEDACQQAPSMVQIALQPFLLVELAGHLHGYPRDHRVVPFILRKTASGRSVESMSWLFRHHIEWSEREAVLPPA